MIDLLPEYFAGEIIKTVLIVGGIAMGIGVGIGWLIWG
jgi:hypothetical protein